MSDDDSVERPSTAQSTADTSLFPDSRLIDPKLSMEPIKPLDQYLRSKMPANPTFGPHDFPLPPPSTDPDVQLWTRGPKRGREEIDEPVSVDGNNSHGLSQLYEGGEQQAYAPNTAKKLKLNLVSVHSSVPDNHVTNTGVGQNFDTKTITSPNTSDVGGLEEVEDSATNENKSGEQQVCKWGDCGELCDSGNDLAVCSSSTAFLAFKSNGEVLGAHRHRPYRFRLYQSCHTLWLV